MKKLAIVTILLFSTLAFSHGKKHHGEAVKIIESPVTDVALEINEKYKKDVREIIVSKCFNCHSSQTNYPWYHKLPVISRIIDSHISEGLSHIDMTKDFPFNGHGGPVKDLEAIINVIQSDEMPPWYYTPFNKNSKLTELEKQTILSWSKSSLAKLKEKK